MSLIKKSGNKEEYVVPLTTGYTMINTSDGPETLKMKSMLSKEKIYFPGTDPIVASNHEIYDSTTQGFLGYSYVISSNAPTITVGGGNGWSYLEGPSLNNRLINDKNFYAGFNRIDNWYEIAKNGTTKPESSFYDCTSNQRQVVDYSVTNNVRESSVSGFSNSYRVEFANDVTNYWRTLWSQNKEYDIDVFYAYEGQWWGSAVCVPLWKLNSSNSSYSAYCTAYISSNCTGMENYVADHPNYHFTATLDKSVFVNDRMVIWGGNTTTEKILYTSGFSANISNCRGTNMITTGDNVVIEFTRIGNNVPGRAWTVGGGQQSIATVTANVTYQATENGVSVSPTVIGKPSIDAYDWGYVEAVTGLSGGGGGYQWNITGYLPYMNKSLTASPQCINLQSCASGKYWKMATNDDVIPDYYGGCMIFSATGLDNIYNNGSRNIFIGFKGISTIPNESYSNYSENNTNNWGCKIYKFNSDCPNFKKIKENTYFFQDDNICKINNYADNIYPSGTRQRTYPVIGPCMMAVTAYTYINDNGTTSKTFNVTGNTTATVLETMNYITPGKNWEYITSKPANSIYFNDITCQGNASNFGVTDKISYLRMFLPTNCVYNNPLQFNKNVTEISLGRSTTAFSAVYHHENYLTELSSIDFGQYTYNIKRCEGLCQTATKLVEVKSFSNIFNSVERADSMFNGCTALTSEFRFMHSFQNMSAAPNMFKDCKNVSGKMYFMNSFNKLEEAPDMFAGCSNLNFDSGTGYYSFPSLTSAPQMFMNCTSITDIPSDFISYTLSAIQYMPAMFNGCTAITSNIQPLIDDILTKFGNNTTNYGSCFAGCINVPNYSTYTAASTDYRIRVMFGV